MGAVVVSLTLEYVEEVLGLPEGMSRCCGASCHCRLPGRAIAVCWI